VRMAPGQTDLKTATAIQLSDVQVGDRMLAGGTASDDGKSVTATSAVIMRKSDVAEKQGRDREEWQKHGTGGVVKGVNIPAGTITLLTGTLGTSTLTLQISKNTIIRRYAPDSWNIDDAKPGTLDQVKPGDQVNARGTRGEDGSEMDVAEMVSGTFRSVVATVISVDAANNNITLNDLLTRRPVTLKIASDSQMHQLPTMFAQRIAMRLKGGTPAGAGATAAAGPPTRPQGGEARTGGDSAPGGARQGGPPDFQQMLNRMPAVTPGQLQKGDALWILATEGTAQAPSTVIILLSGVEPILTAASPSAASTILSPWNLSTSANAGTGDTP